MADMFARKNVFCRMDGSLLKTDQMGTATMLLEDVQFGAALANHIPKHGPCPVS
jgi:hypothetical protein